MFGYVVVDKPSLRIREYDYYRATYCGLCHAMGKCTGCVSRLTLSYDMTFFALLRGMLEEEKFYFKKKRCVRHPIRKIDTVVINPSLEYSAYISGLMTAGKLADNINDEKGMKSTLARIVLGILAGMKKKSKRALPELEEMITEKLSELSALERDKVPSIDAPANVFGELMSELLSYGLKGNGSIIARNIGNRLGRWIYIVDAFDDYDADRKSGSYNPFVLLYGGEDFSESDTRSISMMLEAELAMAFSAIELLEDDLDRSRSEIIKNILCLGMPASVRRICDKHINKIRRI